MYLFVGVISFLRLHQLKVAIPLLAVILSFLCCGNLMAVRNRYYDDENAILVKELRDTVDDIRHEVNNHESEIRVYDEKLKSLEDIIDGLRDQLNESSQAQKELLKGNSTNLEVKIAALETLSKGLVSDLRQFKTHANDASAALMQYKQKISELEKIVEQQNQNIDHLQVAMRALMEALQDKDSGSNKGTVAVADGAGGGTYRVKAGDSLGKIALENHTTIQVLKDLNGLAHDRIVVGQLLRLPEK